MRTALILLIATTLQPWRALAGQTPAPQVAASPSTAPAVVVPKHTERLRDPFRALIEPIRGGTKEEAGPRDPGKAGLMIGEITVQGVALGGPTGSVALVANPEGRTYFLRPEDKIYDGVVLRIDPNGVLFRKKATAETGSGGQVFKKITDSSGVQAR